MRLSDVALLPGDVLATASDTLRLSDNSLPSSTMQLLAADILRLSDAEGGFIALPIGIEFKVEEPRLHFRVEEND